MKATLISTLNAMKTGEQKSFGDNPCYPVVVTKLGRDAFRFDWCGETATLADAAKRLMPTGIYG